ncbi:hypothetical protein E2C01_050164 [Portunus trituberculatus]|uniref:Uncharacterized protein n=1 Tax=Portunus trituberculatus TaxID=210409 RepID=A0A5B7G896_PORTR|nr:hypothetical protein [Portunus trituberculatus]
MNPDGYVNDEPFLASVLEQPMAGKTADAASKVASASNGIASVNGLNARGKFPTPLPKKRPT